MVLAKVMMNNFHLTVSMPIAEAASSSSLIARRNEPMGERTTACLGVFDHVIDVQGVDADAVFVGAALAHGEVCREKDAHVRVAVLDVSPSLTATTPPS